MGIKGMQSSEGGQILRASGPACQVCGLNTKAKPEEMSGCPAEAYSLVATLGTPGTEMGQVGKKTATAMKAHWPDLTWADAPMMVKVGVQREGF